MRIAFVRSNCVRCARIAVIPAFENALWFLQMVSANKMAHWALTGTPLEKQSLKECDRSSHRIASRRLERAVVLLAHSGKQPDGASRAAPDRFHRDRLHFFAVGVRELSLLLSCITSHLKKGGEV